ncbi:MAG: hypothetical protein JNL81_01420 [Hyphomonadaceae bacterium]|nr:hypothetical protein [Hyphomonadaceae bacterium]
MLRRLSAAALSLAFIIAGCAVTPVPDVSTFAEESANNSFEVFDRRMEANALVLPVAHDRQTEGPSCGAHALASVINYWRGPGTIAGNDIYASTPPAQSAGYSIAELLTLAQANGLVASGVRLDNAAIIRELESGRPVLVAVRLPSIYVQNRTFPGANTPVIGYAGGFLSNRVGQVSELTGLEMVDHYLLVVGYDDERFVVVEPVMGYRTISQDKLDRYRSHFGNASIVFSANRPPQRASRG